MGNDTVPTHLSGIYVVGPSSSGKTTLCNAIASRLSLPPDRHVAEVARKVMRSTSFTREHVGTLAMQQAILQAQLEAERSARAPYAGETVVRVAPFLLSDRSGVDPVVYASLSTAEQGGAERLIESNELSEMLPTYRDALFVLLHPVEEWIQDDGIRSLDDPRKCSKEFKLYLDRFGIDYREIGGELMSLGGRVDQILRWAENRRGGSRPRA